MSVLSTLLMAMTAGVGVYFVLTAGEFAFRLLASVPAKMWAENQETITSLDKRLRRLADNAWQGLNHEQRQVVSSALGEEVNEPQFLIYNSPTADCRKLGADIYHAVEKIWYIPFPPIVHEVPLASGITIVAAPTEKRAEILQIALKKVGLDVEIEPADGVMFHIQIGPKPTS